MATDTERFTLRLTEEAARNFEMVVSRDGLTQRSAVEAAVELATLFCGSVEARRALVPHLLPEPLERAVAAAWQATYVLAARHRQARETRIKVDIRIERTRMDALEKCVAKRHLPLNAAVAAVFTPWGSGWCPQGDPAYDTRLALWTWAAQRARQRDFDRRSRRTPEGAEVEASHVAGKVPALRGVTPRA